MNEHQSPFRPVAHALRPKSIAIVGASERGRWPQDIYNATVQHGYAGDVRLINPRQAEVYGQRAWPSLRELPEPVEHAIVIVPAAAVMTVLEDAHARGVKSATIYSGAMGDGDGEASRERGAALRAFITRTGMNIAGPNCMGALSYREKLFAYPNPSLAVWPAGPVGCVFQSGGTLQFFMKTGGQRGLRFSYAVSSGNEVDLDLADYVNFLVGDEATQQIVLFIEGVRRPQAFMQAAARALEAGKPIIAIKTGATEQSAHAAASHTGAIAGDYEAYLAMCERYGVISCACLDDLVETTLAFQCGRAPKGPRVGWVTTSGGTVDLLYDYVEQEKTPLARFSDGTVQALQPYMQEGIKPKNPLDAGIPSTIAKAAEQCAIVAKDPDVDMVAWANQLPGKSAAWPDIDSLIAMRAGTDKPVVGFARMAYQLGPEAVATQEKAGFPFLQGLPSTCRALNALWFHAQRSGRRPATPAPAAQSDLSPLNLDETLRSYGVEQPRSALVVDEAAAVSAAEGIGYPVVLKIRSADISHKTEAGGVAVGLRNRDEVAAAAQRLLASAKAAYPDARIDGFLVQEMVGGVEAIVGAREDALYGPMLLVGSGGVLVELVKDAALRMLPLGADDVSGMVDGLKLSRLLAGFRGKPAADRAALERVALGLGRFYLDHRAAIADIEINPLIVRADGEGACAVDVRVVWK